MAIDLSILDDERFREWIVEQRWFGSKAREVAHIEIAECVALREEPPQLALALVEARFGEGTHETYQVPLGLRPADEGWSERVIAEAGSLTIYDALADPACGRELLHRMRSGSEETEEEGTLRFRWAETAGADLGGTVDVRPVGVEQSNSSIVFGEALILKAFRRVEPGVNPELELLRFLSERGFPNIAVAGRLVRVRGPVHRRHAGHPAGVPGGRARRLGAGARGDRLATRRGCSTGCASSARSPASCTRRWGPTAAGRSSRPISRARRRWRCWSPTSTSRSSGSSSTCRIPRPSPRSPAAGRTWARSCRRSRTCAPAGA